MRSKKLMKRIMATVLAAVMILAVLPAGTARAEDSVTTGWGKDQMGSFRDAGWDITGADYAVNDADGSLTFQMNGSTDSSVDHHPQLVNQSLQIDAAKYKKLEVTYTNTTGNTGAQFYFLEDKDVSGGFQGGDRGIGFSVEGNTEGEKVVTIPVGERVSWTGTIGAIRFNPVNTDDGQGMTGEFTIISMKFIGEETETPTENATAWGKGQEAKLKDWTAEDADPVYEADGSAVLNITGPDTKLIHERLNVAAGTYKALKLTYINDTACKIGEAFFIPDSQTNNGFQGETNVTFEVETDGKEHTVYIPFSDSPKWNGTITGIRIDPVKDLTSGTFKVISMELSEETAPELELPCEWDWDVDGDFLDWTYNSKIVDPEVKDSCLVLPIEGEDPNLTSPKVSINATLYPTMEIVYKNETDDTYSEIFWNNGNGIQQAYSTSFTAENDGEWHTVRVNLSNLEKWSGKIQGLRYDPIRSGNGTFTIDSIKFIKTSVSDGAIAAEWEWRTDGNTDGWESQRCSAEVKDGRAALTLDGQNDPIFSIEKEVNIDAENFRTLELTYKNNTDQTNAEFYWGDADGNWVAADGVHVKGFATVNDGQWHTLRVPLSDASNWNGTVTKLRIDPTGDGGAGTFELDRVAVLYDGEGEYSRYEMENGYFSVSGAKGLIDKITFDATGSGNYSEDLISGLVYMKMDADDVPYDVYSDEAVGTVEGNTLTISNIKFGTPEMIGKWVITLDGSKMTNYFELDTQGANVTLKNAGFVMDTLWDNNTDAVTGEEGRPGSIKVPFSKMASASDRYHNVYAFKYMPQQEDISTLGLEGEWIDWEGANGFDFNLRFEADTEFVSPVCSIDNLRYLFREPNKNPVELDGSGTFTRTLDITVSESKDITPEHFAKYESAGNESVAQGLNDIMWELGYSREPASGNMDWLEWTSLTRAWRQDNYYQEDKNQVTNAKQITENTYEEGDPGVGYIYTWGDSKGWPFPTNRDANHYLTSTANYLNAFYNFYSYSGDEEFLNANIDKIRLGMRYLLTQFSDEYGVFLIDHEDHNGVADLSDNKGDLLDETRMKDAVGSNYWDITPYGYLSAYDNIYCYIALLRTAELEQKLGNTERANELNSYAETLKASYNELFWKENHYIQTIDAEGEEHDFGAVYLNLEALNYGLASEEQAATIMNYLDTTVTDSGEADVFSRFAFAPRVTMFDNQNWYVYMYGNPGEYGVKQLQNGGGNMYTMYYELMSWIKTGNSDRAYERIKGMVEFFNANSHLQGNKDIEGVGNAQHFQEGIVGIWGEFPESGLVPVAVKDGFMGIQASLSALEITPNMPTQMPEASLDSVDYNGLGLRITTSNDSVTIEALTNVSGCAWEINGELVETDENGLFTKTIAISKGDTVVLAKADQEDPEPVVDKSKLEAEIGEAALLEGNKDQYTEESWNAFETALADAKACMADENATQESVDQAAKALEDAIKALVKKNSSSTPSGPSDGKPGNNGSTTNKPSDAKPGNTGSTTNKTSGTVATGDTSANVYVLFTITVLAFAAALAAAAVLNKKRKRQ